MTRLQRRQTATSLVSDMDEDMLMAVIHAASNRLADLDGIGEAMDFLSDVSTDLDAEVAPFDQSARGRDEYWARVEEGRE